MASSLRRTDDLQRLKTRNLVLQNTDGTYPTTGGILYIDSATGHVGDTSGATITGDGRISCTNIRAVSLPGDDNIFTNIAMKRNIAPNEVAGRIATGATMDELFIESVRYIRMAGINSAYGQNTLVVDVCAGVVTVNAGVTGGLVVNRQAGVTAAALTVNGGSVLRTRGIDNQISTTEIWSNAGAVGDEREIGRLATDGNTGSSPTGTFYVQGERYVTLTTINNTPGTMPVYIDVSAGQTNINGTLVLNPIGSSTPYGGITIASPLFSAGARTGEMYFTGTTLYIKTSASGVTYNGWKRVSLFDPP